MQKSDNEEQRSHSKEKSSTKLNILTDPNSPLHKAPQNIQALFSKTQNDEIVFSELPKRFEEKRTQLPICTRIVSRNEQEEECFTCHTCFSNTSSNFFIFCVDCFDPEKHENHLYEKLISTTHKQCDCGKEGVAEKNFLPFCQKHGKLVFQQEMSRQGRKQYIEHYQYLLQIMVYQGTRIPNFNEVLLQQLQELTKNSMNYINLTIEILRKNNNFLLEKLIKKHFSEVKFLLFNLFPDLDFLIEIAKTFAKIRNSQQEQNSSSNDEEQQQEEEDLKEQNDFICSLLANPSVLETLSEEKIFFPEFVESYGVYAVNKNEKGKQLFTNFLNHELSQKNKSNFQLLSFISENFVHFNEYSIDPKVDNFLLGILLSYFSEEFERQNEMDENQVIQMIFETISKIYSGNFSNIEQCFNKFSPEKAKCFETFLKSFFSHDNVISIAKLKFPMSLMLLLFSKNQSELITMLWKSVITKSSNILVALLKISDVVVNINLTHFYTTSEKQNWLRNFLYEKRQVKFSQIMEMRRASLLCFEKAGEILKELCYFNQQQKLFIYESAKQYPKNLMILPPFQTIQDIIKLDKVRYHKDFTVVDEIQKKVSEMLFNHPSFYKAISEKWTDSMEKYQKNTYELQQWKNVEELGMVYVFILVLAFKLGGQKNKDIKEEIQLLKKDSEARFKYEYFSEPNKIEEILGMEIIDEEEDSAAKEKKNEEIKEKGEIKKKKLKQKYKENNLNMIQRLTTRTYSLRQDADLCLICHEKSKEQSPLLYLADVQKSTVCTEIYGKLNSITDLKIESCFHTIHIECFQKMNKENGLQVQCPLCSRKGNCLMPSEGERLDWTIEKSCFNLINANIVKDHGYYFADNLFIILFQHLIQSKGLDSLLSLERYEETQIAKTKLNSYILETLKQIYKSKTESQKEKIHDLVYKMIEKVENDESLIAHIQKLLAKLIMLNVTKNQIQSDISEIKIIKEKMIQQEFAILKNEIMAFVDLEALENLMDQEQYGNQKVSFSFFPAPETSEQITRLKARQCKECQNHTQDIICLICGICLCYDCESKVHKSKHTKILFIDLRNGEMFLMRRSNGSILNIFQSSVFYNNFQVPFKHWDSEKDEFDDIFRVKKSKVKIMEKRFLEN